MILCLLLQFNINFQRTNSNCTKTQCFFSLFLLVKKFFSVVCLFPILNFRREIIRILHECQVWIDKSGMDRQIRYG